MKLPVSQLMQKYKCKKHIKGRVVIPAPERVQTHPPAQINIHAVVDERLVDIDRIQERIVARIPKIHARRVFGFWVRKVDVQPIRPRRLVDRIVNLWGLTREEVLHQACDTVRPNPFLTLSQADRPGVQRRLDFCCLFFEGRLI